MKSYCFVLKQENHISSCWSTYGTPPPPGTHNSIGPMLHLACATAPEATLMTPQLTQPDGTYRKYQFNMAGPPGHVCREDIRCRECCLPSASCCLTRRMCCITPGHFPQHFRACLIFFRNWSSETVIVCKDSRLQRIKMTTPRSPSEDKLHGPLKKARKIYTITFFFFYLLYISNTLEQNDSLSGLLILRLGWPSQMEELGI